MQFLLLDLGHLDLGFDPKSEIVRVYAYSARTGPRPRSGWPPVCGTICLAAVIQGAWSSSSR